MFKVNNKTAEGCNQRHSAVFIVVLENISHLFSSISLVDFEEVNVSWVVSDLNRYASGGLKQIYMG